MSSDYSNLFDDARAPRRVAPLTSRVVPSRADHQMGGLFSSDKKEKKAEFSVQLDFAASSCAFEWLIVKWWRVGERSSRLGTQATAVCSGMKGGCG